MRDTILWRVVWKEYRLQRPLWLTIAVFSFLLQLVVLVVAVLNDAPRINDALFSIALGVPVLYALACGATLFAAERETETFDFQRCLPVSAGRVTAGKLLLGIGSALLLMLFGWLVACVLSGGELPKSADHLVLWVGTLVMLLEVFAWTALFSLLLHRVIYAAILGGVAALLFGFYAVPTLTTHFWIGPSFIAHEYVATLPGRAILAAIVVTGVVWLGRRWFRTNLLSGRLLALFESDTVAERDEPDRPYASTALLHLVWQSWRQMRGAYAAILIGLGVLTVTLIVKILMEPSRANFTFSIPLAFLPVVTALCASCMFWSDQRREMFQFFAERGVSARLVWLSRHCIAVPVVLAWGFVALVGVGIDMMCHYSMFALVPVGHHTAWESPQSLSISFQAIMALGATLGLTVLCYSVGQLASLLLRSGILGLCVGGFCCLWTTGWATLMVRLQVPLWFSVAPIPLILLLGSWFIAPAAFRGEVSWRVRFRIGAALFVPMLLVGVSVAGYRAWEIPAVQPDLPFEQYQQPPTHDATETATMYREAIDSIVLVASEASAVASQNVASETLEREPAPAPPNRLSPEQRAREQAAIDRFVAASRRDVCWFPTMREISRGISHASPETNIDCLPIHNRAIQAADRILANCRRLQEQGDLGEAWQQYSALLRFARCLHQRADWSQQMLADSVETRTLDQLPTWAAHSDQTGSTIRDALEELDRDYFDRMPSRVSGVIGDYVQYRGLMDFDPVAWEEFGPHESERQTARVLSVALPWEFTRMSRLLDVYAQRRRKTLSDMNASLNAGEGGYPARNADASVGRWMHSTLFPPGLSDTYRINMEAISLAARRRAVRLQFATASWQAEHGELPESLEDLVDHGLKTVPVDPYSGLAFQYDPDGVPVSLPQRRRSLFAPVVAEGDDADQIPPNQPFLWIPGPFLRHNPQRRWEQADRPMGFADFFYQPSGADSARRLANEWEMWSLGWCFPVPQRP